MKDTILISELHFSPVTSEYANWRVPTLEELLSMIEPVKSNGQFYIDPIFKMDDPEIPYDYWSADQKISGNMWVVSYIYGYI